MVQKTFREFTIADDESHSQGSRVSVACDLLLTAFSKQIHSKTRIHTRGQSLGFLQGLSPENSLIEHAYTLGDCPREHAYTLGDCPRDYGPRDYGHRPPAPKGHNEIAQGKAKRRPGDASRKPRAMAINPAPNRWVCTVGIANLLGPNSDQEP